MKLYPGVDTSIRYAVKIWTPKNQERGTNYVKFCKAFLSLLNYLKTTVFIS